MRRWADSADKNAIKQQPAETPLHSIAAMAFAALLTVLVLIHKPGDLLGAEVRSSIIGGQDADRSEWPWMAYLNISDNAKQYRCGGTILNDQWVLSAASCWDINPGPNLKKSMVWVGSHELEKGAVYYMGIAFFLTHPEYRKLSTGGYVNNIGLVKLKKKIKPSKDIKFMNLPDVDDTFDSSSQCWITGWGNIKKDTKLQGQEILQELKISVISDSDCKAKRPELTSDMMCAGDMDGGKDACTGDYGGPLVCRAGRGYVQAGIMSYGECGLRNHPGVYTRVSKYLRFIKDYINKGEEASAEM